MSEVGNTNQEYNYKLRIDSFTSDPTLGGGGGGTTWEASINPETIRKERAVKFNSDYSANYTSGLVKQFAGYEAEKVHVKFVLDGTGSIDGVTSITEKLNSLIDLTYVYNGDIHKVPWLKVTLGKDESFYCHLENMDVEYTKYKPDGEPQRAEISMSFIYHTHPKNKAHTNNTNSPDMSHMINIKDGDRITLYCDDIYSDFSYYTDIADANNLTNFRNLKSGTKLVFPPMIS